MTKKILPAISLGVVTILAILFLSESGNENRNVISSTFFIDAVYYDAGYVEITFHDKSEKSSSIVMEILGMDKSFQKTYHSSQFVEIVEFPSVPQYGWQVHPITLLIDHEEFGMVSLKTEIHDFDKPPPPIVYGKP